MTATLVVNVMPTYYVGPASVGLISLTLWINDELYSEGLAVENLRQITNL